MDLYPLLIFVHVLGAVGLFTGLGIEAVALRRLLRTGGVEGTRTWIGLLKEAGRIGMAGMATLLIAGVWMMAIRWGPQPWIVGALVAVGLMIILGVGLTRRAMKRLEVSVSEESSRPLDGIAGPAEGSLTVSLVLRLALAIGILGLMTVKPDALGSIQITGASVVIGLGVAIRLGRGTAPSRTEGALERP